MPGCYRCPPTRRLPRADAVLYSWSSRTRCSDNVYAADHISALDGEWRYLVSLVQARVVAGPGFTETMTTIVEIEPGRVALSLQGGFPDWCIH